MLVVAEFLGAQEGSVVMEDSTYGLIVVIGFRGDGKPDVDLLTY